MAYRRTANVVRRLNERHDAIVTAAREAAAEGGMAAVQIVPVAERAGVAAGTVYRYFPAKIDLVGALVEAVAEREIEAVRRGFVRRHRRVSLLARMCIRSSRGWCR